MITKFMIEKIHLISKTFNCSGCNTLTLNSRGTFLRPIQHFQNSVFAPRLGARAITPISLQLTLPLGGPPADLLGGGHWEAFPGARGVDGRESEAGGHGITRNTDVGRVTVILKALV